MDTPGYLMWRGVYGDSFHGFHHYCYGMIYLMRADRHSTPEPTRNFALLQALREIDYVVRGMPRTHALLPEMLTRQGMILRRLKKPKEAIRRLEDASELNPSYWRAYSELAQCYVALDDKKKALEVLEVGLTNAPDAKVLNAMLQDLGGAKRARPLPPDRPTGAKSGAESSSPR